MLNKSTETNKIKENYTHIVLFVNDGIIIERFLYIIPLKDSTLSAKKYEMKFSKIKKKNEKL
jgi:hypothetical protein